MVDALAHKLQYNWKLVTTRGEQQLALSTYPILSMKPVTQDAGKFTRSPGSSVRLSFDCLALQSLLLSHCSEIAT